MKKIVINDLREGMVSDQMICNERGMVLVAKGIPLTNSIINRLRKFNIEVMCIQEEGEEPTHEVDVSTLIAQEAMGAVDTIVDGVFNSRTLNVKKNIKDIESVMYSVLKRPFIQDFLGGCKNNTILYQHSLRTAILSINMGIIQKWNVLNLEYIAMCAILHDIGMGKEFSEGDVDHPLVGFNMLRQDPDVDMLIAVVCLQHHEYYNGTGFPFAFKRTQITEFACLLAMIDYYDRLLIKSHDPRKSMFDTIGKKNILFDPVMVDSFASTIDWSRLYSAPKPT